MQFGKLPAFLKQNFIRHLDGRAGGKHGVGQNHGLASEFRTGAVLGMDMKLPLAVVFAVSGYESILRIVEAAQHPFVKRQAGSHNGRNDDLLVRHIQVSDSKGSLYFFLLARQCLTDFVAENLT